MNIVFARLINLRRNPETSFPVIRHISSNMNFDAVRKNVPIRNTILFFAMFSTILIYEKYSRTISRVLYLIKRCLSFILSLCRHKALAVYPPTSDEQPYCAGIHNLTTHKTYGFSCHHENR